MFETHDAYLRSGQKVHVIEELKDDRCLVAPYFVLLGYEGEEEYWADESPFIVRKSNLFDEAPSPVIAEDIVKLEKRHKELGDQIRQARKELARMEQDVEAHRKRYAHIPQLAQLDQFLDGKITHYVLNMSEKDYSLPRIITIEQATGGEYDREKLGRLLALFGRSKGQLDWRLNAYNDGSGHYTSCVPCLSYEEALAVLTKRVHEKMQTAKTQNLIDLCREYDIPIPDGYLEEVRYQQIELARETLKRARVEHEKALDVLNKLEGLDDDQAA